VQLSGLHRTDSHTGIESPRIAIQPIPVKLR
jgi:hypothetical protein